MEKRQREVSEWAAASRLQRWGSCRSSSAAWSGRPRAGNGYDAANSSGSNLGPTNQKLIDRIKSDVATAQEENPNTPVPIDLRSASSPFSVNRA